MNEIKVSGKAIKVTLMLEAAEIGGIKVANGASKVPLRIDVAGRVLQANLNAKSLRRCITAIQASGPEGVAVMIQGRLEGNNVVDAGIAAQPKTPKPEAAKEAA